MSPTKHGTQTLPDPAPLETIEWTREGGVVREMEWSGTKDDINAKLAALLAEAEAGANYQTIRGENRNGRARCILRIGRTNGSGGSLGTGGGTNEVQTVEELYAVDVMDDIKTAAYFDAIDTDYMNWVARAVEEQWSQTEIDEQAASIGLGSNFEFANWSAKMLVLYQHLTRGVGTYLRHHLVYRKTRYGLRTSGMQATFTGINTVVDAPEFSTPMSALVDTFPDGEWLKRTPSVEHLGKGRWRVSEEYQWALSWSVVYGGTWTGADAV